MTDSVIVEGYARLRDAKKWRTRWLVLRKPSPVADCLLLMVFKDKSDRVQGGKERATVTLEEICGLEVGQCYEGVAFTLAILCLTQTTLLGFDSREALQAWDIRLRYSLGEVHRFSVGILPGTKLESGPATLHLCNNLLAVARDIPPVISAYWNLPDLRRYGPVPNGFVFEGGTRCGYWAGVFLLASAEGEQISFLFDCIVRGISPTRGPFGLRPILPELGSSQTSSEERLSLEAQELERRLSMLSHGSTTAVSSAGGDDRSISGSSDTSDNSQSDCSVGSRLAIWSEPPSNPPGNVSHLSNRAAPPITEKLPAAHGGGARPAAKSQRQLQEIGRQSSSDSGIATGSHSSYTGSFSSYTGSLDINSGEDFGSVFSLPPHIAQDLCRCSCPGAPGHRYQVPTSLQCLYDNPRNLLQESIDKEPSTSTRDTTQSAKRDETTSEHHSETSETLSVSEHCQGLTEEEESTKLAPSSDSLHSCASHPSDPKTVVIICSVCGGFKMAPQSSSSSVPVLPVMGSHQKSWAYPGSGSVRSRELPNSRMSGESPLPKKAGRLVSLLSGLLSFPRADKPPEAKVHRLNPYESMSPALGNQLHLAALQQESRREKRAAIYENCFKCRVAPCHPSPRALPAKMYGDRDFWASQTLPNGSNGRKSQEEDSVEDEEPLHEVPTGVGGQHRCEEKSQAATSDNKKLNGKEQRRRTDPAYEIMESRMPEKSSEAEEKSKYELMGSYSHKRFLQEADEAVFVFSPEAPFPERVQSEGVTYVNIPVSPTSKKQLNYMELELQEPGHGGRGAAGHLPVQRKGSTKYAQIDITATETAHKVGAQHALGRQEGLHTLELRRKGTPH
ncbi:protein Dok-7 isoform X1 [Oryzias melastigma]|uniref:Docking protein 7 n=1 Tax=Oryzias melastigma TaxID=30732 RepID=A0A3B3BUU5_ORYME|nr:protein Dok-7 isoform X1 [Oryzias melastigma]